MSVRASEKAVRFTESVIREMTRLAQLHGAVNLSQGFPDFAAPAELKDAARRAIASGPRTRRRQPGSVTKTSIIPAAAGSVL